MRFLRNSMILSIGIFFISLFFVPSAMAEVQTGTCGSLGWPENTFTCAVSGTTWAVDNQDCQSGYSIDATMCTGSYPAKSICGEGQKNCCISCVSNEEPTLSYGDSCSSGSKCETGTECRSNICQYPAGSVSVGNRCLTTSECGGSSSTLVCSDNTCEEESSLGQTAQTSSIQTGTCGSLNYPDNTFLCSVVDGVWSPDQYNCQSGYSLDTSVCSGNYPATLLCGNGNSQCCVSCRESSDETLSQELKRGESCSSTDICENNTVCRNEMCLRPIGTVTFGNACFDSSECGSGTTSDASLSLLCRNGICDQVTEVDDEECTSDEYCQILLGKENVVCNTGTGLCQTVDTPGSDSGNAEDDVDIADFEYCLQVPEGIQRDSCLKCVGKGEDGDYVYTAVGCVQTNGEGLTRDLIKVMMGISGGVSLLSSLAGAFMMTVSQGDSSKVKESKSLFTASVSGMFFIIFSVFILQFLGVSILQIPGLGS